MTPQEVEAAIPGTEARLSENGNFIWCVMLITTEGGQTHSHSMRVMTDATQDDINKAKDQFNTWKAGLEEHGG